MVQVSSVSIAMAIIPLLLTMIQIVVDKSDDEGRKVQLTMDQRFFFGIKLCSLANKYLGLQCDWVDRPGLGSNMVDNMVSQAPLIEESFGPAQVRNEACEGEFRALHNLLAASNQSGIAWVSALSISIQQVKLSLVRYLVGTRQPVQLDRTLDLVLPHSSRCKRSCHGSAWR